MVNRPIRSISARVYTRTGEVVSVPIALTRTRCGMFDPVTKTSLCCPSLSGPFPSTAFANESPAAIPIPTRLTTAMPSASFNVFMLKDTPAEQHFNALCAAWQTVEPASIAFCSAKETDAANRRHGSPRSRFVGRIVRPGVASSDRSLRHRLCGGRLLSRQPVRPSCRCRKLRRLDKHLPMSGKSRGAEFSPQRKSPGRSRG